MSTFKGTFFKYDVGLVDQALSTQPETIHPENIDIADYITFSEITNKGTVNDVKVLKVKIQGQGVVGNNFIITTQTATGVYTVKAKVTYTPKGASESITNIHTFNLPVAYSSNPVTVPITKSFGLTSVGSLPAVPATTFNPTNNSDNLQFKIAISALPENSDVACSIDGSVLTFSQGFTSGDKENSAISVKLSYIKPAATSPESPFRIDYVPSDFIEETAANNKLIKDINSLPITEIRGFGVVAEQSDGTYKWTCEKFEIDADSIDAIAGTNAQIKKTTSLTFTATLQTPAQGSEDARIFNVIPSGDNISVKFTEAKTITLDSLTSPDAEFIIKTSTGVDCLPTIYIPANYPIPFKYVPANPTAVPPVLEHYKLDADAILVENLDNASTLHKIPIFFKGMNYNEQIHFLTKDKKSVVAMAPAFTVYEQFPAAATGKVFDVTSDAGFVIPAVEEGVFKTRYIRISDLYNAIANKKGKLVDVVPELADRLHAIEVAIDNLCSATLEDPDQSSSEAAEASRLFTVKEKWKTVDIEGLA